MERSASQALASGPGAHGFATRVFENADRSWKCVRRRQSALRNLDPNYLSLKAFLLERFLLDVLYEAPVPGIFSDFLDIAPAREPARAAPRAVVSAPTWSP